jgi:predicted esterase
MEEQGNISKDPHQGQTIRMVGEPLVSAKAAMIMLHGRGAQASDILTLSGQLHQPGYTYLAPQAANNTWYPNRFLAPIETNEPWLSSALAVIDTLLAEIENAGIPVERVVLLGFSQGGCLALEYAARHARRFGGVVGLSSALIGPPGVPRDLSRSLAQTPVFLGCSDVDPHVPKERVEDSAGILSQMGASVTLRLYPDMDHMVNPDEIDFVRDMLQAVLDSGKG